jgi:predicted MPP superfamily phosphohydrolase
METNLDKERAKERKAELLNTFQRMVSFAAEQQVKAILIAGDLFDRKTVSQTARNIVCQTIQFHPEIDFYYLKGNHDEGDFSTFMNEIPDNLKLFTDTWTTYVVGEVAGRTVTVSIPEGADAQKVGEILEAKGLIRDAKLFVLQELLSEYRGAILAGEFELNTSMTAEQMLATLSTEPEPEEEGNKTLDEMAEENPVGRNGTPEDVAQAMVYLADAEFVTGQVLPVNGGYII